MLLPLFVLLASLPAFSFGEMALPTLSTHILDISLGKPVANVKIDLFSVDSDSESEHLDGGITDKDGRYRFVSSLSAGVYKLKFYVKDYFASRSTETLYPFVEITFEIKSPEHYHIPLLLTPFGYSTYRGS